MKPTLTLRDLFWLILVVAMGLGWWTYRQYTLAQKPLRLSVNFLYSDRKVDLAVLPDQPFHARVTTENAPAEDDDGKPTTHSFYCEVKGVLKPKAANGKYAVQLELIEWYDEGSNNSMTTTLSLEPGHSVDFGSNASAFEVLLEEKWE